MRFPSLIFCLIVVSPLFTVPASVQQGDSAFIDNHAIESPGIQRSDSMSVNQVIYLNHSLEIINGASVIYQNCTIYLQNETDPILFHAINGSLSIVESNIIDINQTTWGIVLEPGTHFSAYNTTFNNPGWNYGPYGNETGIYIHTENARFQNNTIISPYYGIVLHEANHSIISNNHIIGSRTGILAHYSRNITIDDNRIDNSNETGIWLTSIETSHIKKNKIENPREYGIKAYNNVKNCSINSNRIIKPGNKGISIHYYSSNNSVFNNIISGGMNGGMDIDFFSDHNRFLNNTVKDCISEGIKIRILSINNKIMRNRISNCSSHGILVQSSASYNTIERNEISNCIGSGIAVNTQSNNLTITQNRILNNGQNGIDFRSSNNNVMIENTIIQNMFNGIYFYRSNSSVIYLNSFIANSNNSLVLESIVNLFDNGSVGNMWSDYNGLDANLDYIGDTPYNINFSHVDRYPIFPLDSDSDNLYDFWEVYVYHTNAADPDTDDDYLIDGSEIMIGTDPLDSDTENDLLLDGYEVGNGTSPFIPDTDGDTFWDYWELLYGSNPLNSGEICFAILNTLPTVMNLTESKWFSIRIKMVFQIESFKFFFRVNSGQWLNTTPVLLEGTNKNATVFNTTWVVDMSHLVSRNSSLEYYFLIFDCLGHVYSLPTSTITLFYSPNHIDNEEPFRDLIILLIAASCIASIGILTIVTRKKRKKKRIHPNHAG